MKKIIKTLLLIIAILSFIKIDAKELVEEQIKMYTDTSYTANKYFFKGSNDQFYAFGKGCYTGTYLSSPNDDVGFLTKYNSEGKVLKQIKLFNSFYSGITKGIETSDGGVVMIGSEPGKRGIYKINKDFTKEWELSFEEEVLHFIDIVEYDNSLFAIGSGIYPNYSTKESQFIIKYNMNGDIIWFKEYEAKQSIPQMAINKSGNIAFLSEKNIDGVDKKIIMLFNNNGEYIKEQEYDSSYSMGLATIDDDFYVFSDSNKQGQTNIIKFDKELNIIKTKEEVYENPGASVKLFVNDDKTLTALVSTRSNDSLSSFILYDKDLNKKFLTQNKFPPVLKGNFIMKLKSGDFISVYEDTEEANMSYRKYDSLGNLISEKIIKGYPDQMWNRLSLSSNDGGFYFIGTANSSIYYDRSLFGASIRKIDKYGNIEWDESLNPDVYYSTYNKLINTKDSGVAIVGKTRDASLTGVDKEVGLIIKYSHEGERKILSFNHDTSEYKTLVEKNNGDYVILGFKKITYNSIKPYLFIYDSAGNLKNEISFDNNTEIESLIDIIEYDDYIYILAKASEGVSVLKLNSNYEIIKNNTYTNEYLRESPPRIIKTNNGYMIITSHSIEKFDKNDISVWKKEYNGGADSYNVVDINLLSNDKIAINGYYKNNYDKIGRVIVFDKNGNELYRTDFGYEWESFLCTYELEDGTIRHVGATYTLEIPGTTFIIDHYYRYDITPKSSNNGTFTVDKIKAKNKEIITINAKPKLGYIVDKVILTDTNGNKTEFRDLTFEMIPDDVEVEVVFKELINPKTGFSLITIIAMITGLIFITIRKKREV